MEVCIMGKVGKFVKTITLFAATALLVSACGGGSDSVATAPSPKATTLSGTAAAGAPIIGTVTIKDSTVPAVTKTVTIEADGNYTVDVSDLTAPYMVRADGYVGGNEYHLYSAGTSADVGGTINITPLTDLIVANIADTVVANYFESGNFSSLTDSELTLQSEALRTQLLPVLQTLGVSSSIDLLRASFNTDHTGIDAALDIIRVETDPNTLIATVTNIITQQTMTSDLAAGTYSNELDDTTGVAEAATDIQLISAGFDTFSNFFATGLPSPTNPTLLGLFDGATFLDGGQDLDSFLSELTSDPELIGIKFTNIAILSLDVAAGTALVGFDVLIRGLLENEAPEAFYMIKKSGKWYMQGSQYIAQVSVEPTAEYRPSDTSSQLNSGLMFHISDRGGRGLTSAVVSGAGLPQGGVTLINNISNENFEVSGQNSGNFYAMNDTQINAIADTGETYTVELYIDTQLAATYTEKIRKRPYLVSELTVANFPAITSPTAAELHQFTGGSATVTWTLPAGLTNDWLSLGIHDDIGNSAMAEFGLLPAERSKTFTLNPTTSTGQNFTVTNRWIWLAANDVYGRRLATTLW
jgi:hypothetical protein